MHPAFVSREVADRMLAFAVDGELVPGTGWRLPGPGPLIADIGPDTRRLGLLLPRRLHLDRGIISEQGAALPDDPPDCISQRFQKRGRTAHPIRHGRAVQIDAFAGVDLRLPVQGKMVGVFADQHMRQQARSRPASFNRAPLPAELQGNSPAGQWTAAAIARWPRSRNRPCEAGRSGSPQTGPAHIPALR